MITKPLYLADLQATIDAIVADTTTDTNLQMEALLKIGVTTLELDMGILSHINGESYHVKYFYPPESGLSQGQIFQFSQTYCEITTRLRLTVAINPMHSSEYKLHPCYEAFKLESYIGMPLILRGQLYGTLNFSSAKPRSTSFRSWDRSLVNMLGKAVLQILEKRP